MDTEQQENILKQIETFADRAHGEQKRKYTPERYIVHTIRVMEMCKAYTQDITVLAAALLHDVLEDTPVKKEELQTFLHTVMESEKVERTMQLVEELTDVYVKKKYPYWNRRKGKRKEAVRIEKISAEAQTVKYADIIDNCQEIVNHDPDFAGVFLTECKGLLKQMTKGDKALYQRAVETVDNCIHQLKKQPPN